MTSRNRYLASAAIALAIAAVAVIAIVSSGASGSTTTSASIIPTSTDSRYGHPPKGLKIAYPAAVTTATASQARPDLYALEGYSVRVTLPTGSALMSVEGPDVPLWVEEKTQAGTLKLTTPVPAVFTVKVSDVSGTIPLKASDFGVELATDQADVIQATGEGKSIQVSTGKTATFKIRAMLPDGDGVIRWTPDDKQKLVAAWSWQLEYD